MTLAWICSNTKTHLVTVSYRCSQTDNWATKDIHKLTIAFNEFRFPFHFLRFVCVCLSVCACVEFACAIVIMFDFIWSFIIFAYGRNDERMKKIGSLVLHSSFAYYDMKSSLFGCQHKNLLWLLYMGFLNRFEQRQLASILSLEHGE